MKHTQKIICVCTVIVLMLTCCPIFAFAEEKPQKSESDIAFEQLEKDIPMILVTGLGGQYYSGLSTETPDDDVRIWEPTMEIIKPVVLEHGFSLVSAILKKDYKKANEVIKLAAEGVFGAFACNPEGVPDPDTGKKENSTDSLLAENGYASSYDFLFDWRLDIVTLAGQLDSYVKEVMELTGADKVAFTATSMGCSILMTYLYNSFYANENYGDSKHIHSAVFIAGTMNGVVNCEDPFSSNVTADAESVVRYAEGFAGGSIPVLRALYRLGIFEPVLDFTEELVYALADNGLYDAIDTTLAAIPGFYALMGSDRYAEVRELVYNTPEKEEKFATILERSDFFHEQVQPNNENIIRKMQDSGIRTAIIAQYGYNVLPFTSDNDRMSDGTIAVSDASFGGTASAPDETLGKEYRQAKQCPCGKSHLSPDLQIDASTCAFADVTWFGRNMIHVFDASLLSKLVDLVSYSEEPITVHTFADLPQFLIREGDSLVALTQENLPAEPIPVEQSIANDEQAAKLAMTIRIVLISAVLLFVFLLALIIFLIVRRVKKQKAKKKAQTAAQG